MSDADLEEVLCVTILSKRAGRKLMRIQIRKARLAQLQEQSGGPVQSAGRGTQEELQKCVVMISTRRQNKFR